MWQHVSMCVCVCVYVHMCVYVCVYVHIVVVRKIDEIDGSF